MLIEFFILGDPPTKTYQEHRIGRTKSGRVYTYEDHELKAVRMMYREELAKHSPEAPMTGAVRLVVKWCFAVRARHRDGEYKVTKPDTDNLVKLLKDEMTRAGFWADDAQVASEITEKFWADIPGIYIRAEEIPERE